jgi:hypothetical protein
MTLSAGQARAAIVDLTLGNSGLSGLAGPFAQVTITDISGGVQLDVQALDTSSLGNNVQHAQITSFGFNLAAGSPSSLTLSYVSPPGQPSGWSTTLGSGNLDGFGHYDFVVGPNGNSSSVREVKFDLTAAGLTSSSFLTSGGYSMAAHWFSNTGTGQNQATGFISGATAVPEPSTVACAGTVTLFGLALAWRRRRARAA